jgi:predicted transposase/invertase (TIGR01784 family)
MEGAEETGDALKRVGYPNDAFFKDVFSEPTHATAFFQGHLPAAIAAKVDWSSLMVLPGSFVKSSLQQIHSDLLFSVQIGGQESLLYLLFEHQSTVDPAMPLRLLGYITEILTSHHKTNGFPLPAVIPFVLHQGPDRWNVSTAFEDMFDLPEEIVSDLLPFLPRFSYALLDLTQFDPATEEPDPRLRIVLHLMKLARERQMLRFFEWLSSLLVDTLARELPNSLLTKLLNYALHADSNLDVEEIYHTLSSNPELQKNTMSVAEKLLAQGEARGEARGETRGAAKGLWIGKIQMLEEFLGQKISSPEDLGQLSIEELTKQHQGLHQAYESRFKQG